MRLYEAVSSTPAGGNVSFTWPEVALDREWVGSVIIPGAPTTALWTLQVNDQSWGVLVGNGPFGPISLVNGERLILKGTSAGASQLTAILIGTNDPAGTNPYTGPAALPSPSAPSIVSVSGIVDVEIFDPNTGLAVPQFPTTAYDASIAAGSGAWGLPALGAGGYYLFGWSIVVDAMPTPTLYALQVGAGAQDIDYYAVNDHSDGGTAGRINANQPLDGFRTVGPVGLAQIAGGPPGVLARAVIRYATGP